MRGVSTIVAVALFGLFVATPCFALSEIQTDGIGGAVGEPLPLPSRRAKTKLRVQPIYPQRHYHSLHPVPYRFDYPGPNAKRQCLDAYVTEHRPSGTVIVPRMRCRWVRG